MTFLQDWTNEEVDPQDISYSDFENLGDFSLAEELLPQDKTTIGIFGSPFNLKLESLCTYLFEHMNDRFGNDWGNAWESLKQLADKGYPEAALGLAQLSTGLAQQGDVLQMTNADVYFEKAKNNPYTSNEMKTAISERQQIAEESFDNTYPDLTKAADQKDFTSSEYAHLDTECHLLKDLAKEGDKNALKRLEMLALRGYPQAQESCGYLALEQGNLKKAESYLTAIKNNHDVLIDGKPIQTTSVGEGFSKALSEERKKNSTLLNQLDKSSKNGAIREVIQKKQIEGR